MIGLYFAALLILGIRFSKLPVYGPIYLHDLVLIILVFLSLNFKRKIFVRFLPIALLLLLSIVYLIISVILYKPAGNMLMLTFRQFHLFFYLFAAYLIFNSLVRNSSDINKCIQFIGKISLASVILQIAYLLYGFAFIPGFALFEEGEYNYFSPLVIFGVISFGAHVLAYTDNHLKRYTGFFAIMLLSTTLGHSSAFFALFVVLAVYFMMKITPLQRFVAVVLVIMSTFLLLLLPQFTDYNASWRLFYWGHIIERSTTEGYGVFGKGFGQPYMTDNFAWYLNDAIHSPIMLNHLYPFATYLNPPHNSILTIIFHLGMIPALLLLAVSLKSYLKQIFIGSFPTDKNRVFLVLTLTACFVRISFNVILELPHASAFFWLVFFTTILYLKNFSTGETTTRKS